MQGGGWALQADQIDVYRAQTRAVCSHRALRTARSIRAQRAHCTCAARTPRALRSRTVRAHRAHCTHTLRGKVKPTNFELSIPILELSLPILELSLPILKTRTVCGGRAGCARTVRAVRAYNAHGARVQYARCVRTVRAVRAYRARGVRVQGARTVRTDRAEKKTPPIFKNTTNFKTTPPKSKKIPPFLQVRTVCGRRARCVRTVRAYI